MYTYFVDTVICIFKRIESQTLGSSPLILASYSPDIITLSTGPFEKPERCDDLPLPLPKNARTTGSYSLWGWGFGVDRISKSQQIATWIYLDGVHAACFHLFFLQKVATLPLLIHLETSRNTTPRTTHMLPL